MPTPMPSSRPPTHLDKDTTNSGGEDLEQEYASTGFIVVNYQHHKNKKPQAKHS